MRAALLLKSTALLGIAGVAFFSFSLNPDVTPLRHTDRKDARKDQEKALDLPINGVLDLEIVDTYARPLFSDTRRPFVARPIEPVENPEAEVPPEQAQAHELPRNLRLLGVNMFGGSLTVLVRNQETEETRWLKTGEEFAGWILSGANADGAHFSCRDQTAGDCSYDVRLYVADQARQNDE